MPEESNDQGIKDKGKGPVKRNSKVRKEQNRISSRNYREKRRQRLALLNQILSSTDGSKHSAAETCPSEDDGIGLWPVDPQPESAACSAFTNEPPEAVNDQLGGVPGNVLGAEPSMAILNTMPAQDWTSYLLGAPESDTHHCAASNTYGNIPIPSLAPGGTILNEGGSFGNWPEGA